MAKPSEYFDKIIQHMKEELKPRMADQAPADIMASESQKASSSHHHHEQIDTNVLAEFLGGYSIETRNGGIIAEPVSIESFGTAKDSMQSGPAEEIRKKIVSSSKSSRKVKVAASAFESFVVPTHWIRNRTVKKRAFHPDPSSKIMGSQFSQGDVIGELKAYLTSKKENQKKKESLLLELVRRSVLHELKSQSIRRIESHRQSRRVIHEFKRRQVLREIAKRSEAIDSHKEKLDQVHAEFTNAYVMRNLSILNMLLSRRDSSEWNSTERQSLFAELRRETRRRSADADAKRMKQCFAELHQRRSTSKRKHDSFDAVIQQIRMRSIRRELLERFYERKEHHDFTHSVMHELIKRAVIDELKTTNGAKEEFHKRKAQVIRELHDRWNWVETQQFKQLVIHEISDRCEALQEFRIKTDKVLSELMINFSLNELKQNSIKEAEKKKKSDEFLHELEDRLEWVNVQEPMSWVEVQDRAEWVVCDAPGWN